MNRSLSILSFVFLLLSSAGLPATASACSLVMDPTGTPPPPPPRDDTDLHWGVALGSGLALNLTLVGLQAAAGDDGFSDVAGGFEVAFGVLEASVGTLFVPGAFLVGAGSTCGDNRAGATYTLGAGIAMMAFGTWHLIHGIWSVASSNDVPDVAPTAWFDDHGGTVGVVGRF
jgi:hypothetical protein